MALLTARVLGQIQLLAGGRHSEVALQPMPRRLLAYLVLSRGALRKRETVAEALWPERDAESARRCLNSTVHRFNQAVHAVLPNCPHLIVSPSSDDIGFDDGVDMGVDLHQFESLLRQSATANDRDPAALMALLEKARRLYRGPLLEGIFQDWAVRERNGLESMFEEILHTLMVCSRQLSDWRAVVRYGRQILDIDALREDIHAELMQALYASGKRSQALRQYTQLLDILKRELAVPPMSSTSQLYETIREGQVIAGLASPVPRPNPGVARCSAPSRPGTKQTELRHRAFMMSDRLREMQRTSRRIAAEVNNMERAIGAIIAAMDDPN